MAYRWSLEGPAFEFPTPYGTENRFLVWRGYALIFFAVVIAMVVSFVNGDAAAAPAITLEKLPEPASVVPHLVAAMLLSLLGARDLWKASAQRNLLLAPGQPGSLAADVPREASGISPGAGPLLRLLEVGEFKPAEVAGPYAAALAALGPDLAAAPSTLHAYLRVRMAHLVLVAGLVLVLLLSYLAFRLPPAQGLAALVPLLLCAGVLAHRALLPDAAALPPWLVALLVLLAGALAGAMGWYAGVVPRSESVPRLGLPLAAAVMLGSVFIFESLGLLAARAQVQAPWLPAVAPEEGQMAFEGDPEQLLRDIDLELHRQWTEGIPNRRYAWQAAPTGRSVEGGRFTAVVLEESQPLVPHAAAKPGREAAPAVLQTPQRRLRGLLALDVAGLLWSLAGTLAWVWLAWAHMRAPGASWVPGAAGIVGLAVGGYALRVGHLLWSRVEVASTLTWLDLGGPITPAQRPAEAGRGRGESLRVPELCLRARVARLRSVFYAAAPHGPGSRVMLELQPERSAAEAWLPAVQELARKAVGPATPALQAAARAKGRDTRDTSRDMSRDTPRETSRDKPRDGRDGREPRPGDAYTSTAPFPPRRPARFCPHCGTPLLQDARFCQHCGSVVTPEQAHG